MTRNARPRSPHARLGLSAQASAEDAKRAHEELVGFLESAPDSLRRWAKGEIAVADAAYAVIRDPSAARRARRRSPRRRAVVAVAALVATVAVVLGVYDLGGQDKASSQDGGTAAGPSLSPGDQVRVSRLMKKLKEKPKDVATLVALGNIFFEAHDYNNAGGWMKQVVAIEPDNVKARMALGASEFNIGDVSDARRDWLRAVALDPKNVEAYYDLGFLYVSKDPPDMANAKEMWGKVVELAPNSDVAKTVSTHLKGLEKATAATAASSGGKG